MAQEISRYRRYFGTGDSMVQKIVRYRRYPYTGDTMIQDISSLGLGLNSTCYRVFLWFGV